MPRFGEAPSPPSSPSPDKRPVIDLVARRKEIQAKKAQEHGLTQVENRVHVLEDRSHEGPSILEQAQQQGRNRQRRDELTDLLKINEQQRQQLEPVVNQSTWYVHQEERALEQLTDTLNGLKKKKEAKENSFLQRTFSRMSGQDKVLDQEIVRAEQVVAEKRRLFEQARQKLNDLSAQQASLDTGRASWSQESSQIEQSLNDFETRFAEKPEPTVERSEEQAWREGLFEKMGEEELKETREAHQSERRVFQLTLAADQRKQAGVQQELHALEAQLHPTAEMNVLGVFLNRVSAENDAALNRFDQAKQKHAQLMAAPFFSRLLRKTEILSLEAEMKKQEEIMRGFDQHFLEAQNRATEVSQDPRRRVAEKQKEELMLQLRQVERRLGLTQQRLLENELQMTEIELRMNRLAHERPAAQVEVTPVQAPQVSREEAPPPQEQVNNVVPLRPRSRASRRPAVPSSGFNDQRMAA